METVGANPKNYAFNSKGIPYDHGIQDRVPFTTLSVRKLSSHSLNTNADTNITIPPLALTDEEKNGADNRAIWVGMALPATDISKTQGLVLPPKRSSIDMATDVTVIPTDPQALRVVVGIKTTQNKFCALVNPERGVCEGLRVKLSDVFFFTEFRDDRDTAEAQRESGWSLTITKWKAEVMAEKTSQTKANRRVQDDRTRSANMSKLHVPWKESIRNQIQALAVTFDLTNASWTLEALDKILTQCDEDLKYAPAATFTGLHQLFAVDQDFTDADVENALKDTIVLWKDLDGLNIRAAELVIIAEGLRAGKLVVPYQLLRPFLVESVRRMREDPEKCIEDDHGMTAALGHVRLQWAQPVVLPAETTQPQDHWHKLLKTIITHLEEILHYGEQYGEAAKKSLGGKATGLPIDGALNLFATSVDIDSAQLALREVFFGAMEMMVAKDEGITSKLKEHLEGLKLLDSTLSSDIPGEASV